MGHIEDKYISLLTDFGYVRSIGAYRDIKNSVYTAKKEGREEGVKEGLAKGIEQGLAKGIEQGLAKGARQEKEDIARKLMAIHLPIDQIAASTGLSEEVIRNL